MAKKTQNNTSYQSYNTGSALGVNFPTNFNFGGPNNPVQPPTNAPLDTTIDSNAITTNGGPIAVPPEQQGTSAAAYVAGLQGQVPTAMPVQQGLTAPKISGNVGTLEQEQNRLRSSYGGLSQQYSQYGNDALALEQQQGVPGFQKTIFDLNTEIGNRRASFMQEQENYRSGQVGTQELGSGKQAQSARNEAVVLGGLSIQLQGAQGNLAGAREEVDRLLNFKYEPIKQAMEDAKYFIDLNYQDLSRADKIKSEDLNRQLTRDMNAVDYLQEISKSAYNNLLSNGGTPEQYTALANATTPSEVIKIGIGSMSTVLGDSFSSTIQKVGRLESAAVQPRVMKDMMGYVSQGDYKSAYDQMGNSVANSLTGELKTKFESARSDIEIMKGMRNAIQEYADSGGDMGLLKGKEEQIKRNLGIDSGNASELGVQLWREFQYYRSNMTGAAFTPKESRDYASVNPTLGKSIDLNLSVIDGALNQLSNRVDGTIRSKVGEGATQIRDLSQNQGVAPEIKLQSYIDSSPGNSQKFRELIQKYPDATPYDLTQILNI